MNAKYTIKAESVIIHIIYFQSDATHTTTSTTNDLPPVLPTESLHVNIEPNRLNTTKSNKPPQNVPTETMRTIELSTGRIREGFGTF